MQVLVYRLRARGVVAGRCALDREVSSETISTRSLQSTNVYVVVQSFNVLKMEEIGALKQ